MLIIQNGSETIHNQMIATRIHTQINWPNRVEIDGYFVDFTGQEFVIYDANDNIVYCEGNNSIMLNKEDGSVNEEGLAALNHIAALSKTKYCPPVIQSSTFAEAMLNPGPTRIRIMLGLIWDDIGIDPVDAGAVNADIKLANKLKIFNTLIERYNTRDADQPYMVISGSFSQFYIDKFRSVLGAENVIIINITRNPSVQYLRHFNTKYPEGFVEREKASADATGTDISARTFDGSNSDSYLANHTRDWTFSMLNSIRLKSLDYVTTILFEDILKNGALSVNGVNIKINELSAANSVITINELSQLAESNITTENVDATNKFFSNYVHGTASISESQDISKWPELSEVVFPKNFFTSLGYEEFTLAEILYTGA